MKQPMTWQGWATRVSLYVREGKKLLDLPRFPIRIGEFADEYSRQLFPREPITMIGGQDFKGKFEGALVPNELKDEWAIIYDTGHSSKGRVNFTLAHEFGHYLAHRHLSGEPFYCSRKEMWAWGSDYALMEVEANSFAAFVLMPPDDFREQTKDFRKPSLHDFEVLRDRYDVSLTAAVLNWLKTTKTRAMLIVGKDGFIDWSWGSETLFSSGVFFRARQITTPLPDDSLAVLGPTAGITEIQHPRGVWNEFEPVFESVVFAEYHEMTLSLLIYPSGGGGRRSYDSDQRFDAGASESSEESA